LQESSKHTAVTANSFLAKYQNFAKVTANIFNDIAGWAITAAMVITVLNVLLRKLFKTPIQGAPEYTSFMIATSIAFGLGYCALTDNHIAIEFLVDKLNKKARRVIKLVTDTFSLFCIIFCVWRIFVYAGDLVESGEVAPTTGIPYYIFVYFTAVGFIVLCIVILLKILTNLYGRDAA
jgi:TRAP-type C4-dicarboxylate transport system permease small subunit